MTNSQSLIPGKSSHWYLPDGTPYHHVIGKNGLERRTTLADARKVGAFPSVTNILGIIASDGLERWKQEQAVLSALTLPQIKEEPLDDYAKRVVTDMQEHSRKASEFGTAVHKYVASVLAGSLPPPGNLYTQAVAALSAPAVAWIQQNVQEVYLVEEVVVGEPGYAGTVDLFADLKDYGPCWVDFKTQNVRKSPKFYEPWPLQLAAYRDAGGKPGQLMSVIINSNTPSDVVVKVWEEREMYSIYYSLFESAMKLWEYVNNYCPND